MGVRSARQPAAVTPNQGPGDLTLASIVLFTIGAYGVAAGAATGQQAVVSVGVFAFTLFVGGIVWPIIAVARVDLQVVSPPDATVGDVVTLHVRVKGRVGRIDLRVLDPAGPWWRTSSPSNGTVPHVAARRGVFSVVRMQLRCSAPLGVFVRTKTVRVALEVPTAVAPRGLPSAPLLYPVPEDLDATASPRVTVGVGDTVRAVRPYVPGDAARLVHWPTSARRGELVVREHEPPPSVGVALVVDLRGFDPEAAAARAMGIGTATLAAGGTVWLGTSDGATPVGERVRNARRLGHLLAEARPGIPAEPPPGWTVERLGA